MPEMTPDLWTLFFFGGGFGWVVGVVTVLCAEARAERARQRYRNATPPPKPKRPPGMPGDGSRTSPGQRPGDDGPKPKDPPTACRRERRCHTEPVEVDGKRVRVWCPACGDPLETIPVTRLRRPRKWPDPPPDPSLIEPSTPPPDPPPDPPRRTPDDYAPAAPEYPGPSSPSPAKQDATPTKRTGHPEDHCDECGRPNVSWGAANDRWHHATGTKPGEGPNPVLCPVCFIRRWERATGLTARWWVEPERLSIAARDWSDDEPEPTSDYYGDNLARLRSVIDYARTCAEANPGSETAREVLVSCARIESKNPLRKREQGAEPT